MSDVDINKIWNAPFEPTKIREASKNLWITPEAYYDQRYLVDLCHFEVSWFGEVVTFDKGLLITRIHLLHQVGGPSHTQIDPSEQSKLMRKIDKEGRDTGCLRLWGHSHASMGVGPSGQDIAQFDAFGKGGAHGPDWWINLILNKRGDVYSRFDLFTPVRYSIEGVKIRISSGGNPRSNYWTEKIKEMVQIGKQKDDGRPGRLQTSKVMPSIPIGRKFATPINEQTEESWRDFCKNITEEGTGGKRDSGKRNSTRK